MYGGTICCGGGYGAPMGCVGALSVVCVVTLIAAFFMLVVCWQLKDAGLL